MHTVISSDCTGCDLCIAPCPVDCIVRVPLNIYESDNLLSSEKIKKNKFLYQRRKKRIDADNTKLFVNEIDTNHKINAKSNKKILQLKVIEKQREKLVLQSKQEKDFSKKKNFGKSYRNFE